VSSGQKFIGRYRAFLLNSGTIFTLMSFLLLVAAVILTPMVWSTRRPRIRGSIWRQPLLGQSLSGGRGLQGIREGDFTLTFLSLLPQLLPSSLGNILLSLQCSCCWVVMLEAFVSARASNALDALAKLLPDQVTVRRDGEDLEIALQAVHNGDIVLIRSGSRIPVDGIVILGTASVNQAAITGESLPVEKQAGDTVFAGNAQRTGNLGSLYDNVGEETTLGQIRRMVEEAKAHKAPIERLLNRYAKFYTPAAIILGALVWWFSGDLLRAITILIVFCPCVMVLATPTALVASIGNAALRGSLVKQGATIEAMAKINVVAFDKTGTLTCGQPG